VLHAEDVSWPRKSSDENIIAKAIGFTAQVSLAATLASVNAEVVA